LRSLKKIERPVHKNSLKNQKTANPIKIKNGLNLSEFREKYALFQHQILFKIEKLDADEQASEIGRHRQRERERLEQRISEHHA